MNFCSSIPIHPVLSDINVRRNKARPVHEDTQKAVFPTHV